MVQADVTVSRQPLFSESQRLTQPWVWILVVLIALLAFWSFIQQIVFNQPFGGNAAPDWLLWTLLAAFGVGLPTVLAMARLDTRVYRDRIHLRYVPFASKSISLDMIESVEAREYRPLREYGGWGLRWSPWAGSAFTVSGKHGVQLVLQGGRRFLIGSQQAEQLAGAIKKAQSH
ncbi:hypothetical protein GF420_06730 [candidate division GN15 bacterium]|nr:hypothetical protein [candidate division GN15 bacterium]